VLGLAFDLTLQREWAEQSADEARAIAIHTRGFWRFGAIVTRNRRFADCLQLAERAAGSDITVLLQGETGVGKEHLARGIHAESERRSGPFVVYNCAEIAAAQMATELFGAKRGAIPDEARPRPCSFDLARGGTLLVADIGQLPLRLQARLERVLSSSSRSEAVDRARAGSVDVRVLAATGSDLSEEVRAGRFDQGLFLRLSLVALTLPPLRQRIEDVPALARGFLQLEARRSGRRLSFCDEALRALARHAWPGNVAELQGLVEKLCVLSEGPEIGLQEVESAIAEQDGALGADEWAGEPARLRARIEEAEQAILELKRTRSAASETGGSLEPAEGAGAEIAAPPGDPQPKKSYREQLDDSARALLARTIRQEGSISAAARVLGLSRQQVYLKCKRLGLKDS
jgi:two-component system, NtrC family, response regulator AtoC